MSDSIKSIDDFPSVLKSLEQLNFKKYRPLESNQQTKSENKYDQVDSWDDFENVKLDLDSENRHKINNLQMSYSVQSGGHQAEQHHSVFWYREGLVEDKNKVFADLCMNSDEPKRVLCLGPRWASEITFISNVFNCNAVGLDLFSYDLSLVKVGDMHKMPFVDNQFDIVYQKNTFNKSYDIRKCLDECVRVLKNGGALVSDEILDYKIGVNEIARTSISNNAWYSLYLKDNLDKIILDKQVELNYPWAKNAGLYAAKIKK